MIWKKIVKDWCLIFIEDVWMEVNNSSGLYILVNENMKIIFFCLLFFVLGFVDKFIVFIK